MAEKRDYYDVLGLTKSASKDEIKSSYRKLAKQYHPDNKETGNEAKFKEVQEAYDVLYDDKKRATYDQFGHAAFEQAGGNPGANPFEGGGFGGFGGFGSDGVDLGDIFSSFFGGGSRRSSNTTGPKRGNDRVTTVTVDFIEAILGKDINLSVTVDEQCKKCGGTGAKTPNDLQSCPHCGGHGYVKVQRRSLFGVMESQEACPYCGGTGKIIREKCPDCGGKGYVRVKKDIKVHILAGINQGQQIRVSGMGERGSNGGPNGDLYIEINIKPHSYFVREGNDIHLEVPLDFVDAVLGTKIDIPTVYGNVSLTIPAGTQPGQIMRMRGQGIKDLRSGKPGDQYVHLKIKVPTSINKTQKELLEKFKNETSEKDSLFDQFRKKFKK